jgi:hypothetical protein
MQMWPNAMQYISMLYQLGHGFSFASVDDVLLPLRAMEGPDFGGNQAVFDRTYRSDFALVALFLSLRLTLIFAVP